MATGGIALNGSTQYLELNSRVVSAFPFTLVCWVAQNASGSSQFAIAQQQSNGDRYAAGWLDANGTTKYAALRNPGSQANATKTTSPHPTSSLQLMVAVFASTTSRTIYFGNNTGVTATDAVTDDISNHDRVTIGAWHYNSGAAGLFLNGVVAEAHIFNTALTSTDVTTLLTTTPESVSGWVDGWILDSASNLTSIGGTRTLTAVGSPTTASLTLPYTRSTGPTIDTQPQNTSVNEPSGASLTVAATGTGTLTYQWKRANPGSGTFSNVGTNSTTLPIASTSTATDNGAQYKVDVTDSNGTTTSNTVTLTVRSTTTTSRPSSDVTVTGWTASGGGSLFDMIDETSASDSDYIISPTLNAGTAPITFGLQYPLAVGTWTVGVRAHTTSGGGTLKAELLDAGGTVVGTSSNQTINSTFTSYSLAFTTTGVATRIRLTVTNP